MPEEKWGPQRETAAGAPRISLRSRLDVKRIGHVFNCRVPNNIDIYVQRIDRLGAQARLVLSLPRSSRIVGAARIGVDLTKDHPINFAYDDALASADRSLAKPGTRSVAKLLLDGGVQCSSCHGVHDPAFPPLLRMDNSGSGLLLTCYEK